MKFKVGRVFMMEIQSSKIYQKSIDYNQKRNNFSSNLSFKNKVKLSDEALTFITNATENNIKSKIPFINWISQKLAKYEGEVQNQVINAIFTTTLAPAFIAWNPFSKQDENTKKYTALRQPISAAIAIAGGLPMTNLINSYMNKMGSEGYIESIDLRMKPNENYLKSRYKKAKKMLNGKKVDFATYVKAQKKVSEEFFTDLISTERNKLKIDENTKIISILKPDIKTGENKWTPIGQNIPNMTKKVELDRYLEKNNLHEISFRDFMKNELKFEFFEDGTIKPHTIKDKLENVKAMDFLRKFGVIEKGELSEHDLNKLLSIMRQKAVTEKEVTKAFNDGVFTHNGPAILTDAFGKQAARSIQLQLGEKVSKLESITLGQFFERFNYTGAKLQELMGLDMYTVLTKISEPFQSTGMKQVKSGDTLQHFASNILKNRILKTESYFKNFKTYAGIGFNLITTAITCTALNWAYPRLVEYFFPQLVKEPQETNIEKGGNK
jgi:hypothetical protein